MHHGRVLTYRGDVGMQYTSGGFQLPICPVFLGLLIYFIWKHFGACKAWGFAESLPPPVLRSSEVGECRNNKQVALTSQRLQIRKPVEMNTRNCDVKWFFTSDNGRKTKHRKEVDFSCDGEQVIQEACFQYRWNTTCWSTFITFCISGSDHISHGNK